MPSIPDWLQTLDLEHYASILVDNEVDFKTLQVLTDKDLKELGLPFGPRKRLLNALAEFKVGVSAPAMLVAAPSLNATATATDTGERRQLTVLFCDMVGFTELANRLDPEVLQTIIRSYEDACAVCITRYEGYVFQRLGDGIVAFFGYPLAHEGEADRAIRAGLEIIESLSKLEVVDAGHLQVRIGIAAGLVVVSSAEKGAVGEAMNLASRLQSLAQPGSLVVSERVHKLAGGSFQYEDLGEHALKGIPLATRAWRVCGVSGAASRFDAATQDGLTPLVGREQEIGLLLEHWQLAQDGEGQVVLLSGEPGIGKSRIMSALREALQAQGAGTLRFQCSPYHVNSAFYPTIDNFERTLKFDRDEPAATKLDKLEALVVSHYGGPLEDVRFIASLLSIPCEERYGPITMTPQQHKHQTIRALVDLTEAAARRRPSAMLFEDAHWADPSTLDSMDVLIDRVRNFPLLIVITYRPEFQPRWSEHGHVTALNLSKLTRAQCVAMVSKLTAGKALPAGLLEQIIAKTDGVPLFVEELTKSILESGDLKDEGDCFAYVRAAASVTIPSTLRDSLMARLDRVKPVKEIAQIGAAIGREFSYELISAVASMSTAALDDRLARLTESGLAFRRGTMPQAVYIFKHALVQDAAYDSLLKSRRQELHGKIARVLEERFPATRDTEPELLARHYTAAGLNEAAVVFWRRAGELSMQRFALPEAVAHLRKGLALLDSLPAGPGRDLKELELRTQLGPALVAVHGWAAPEVSDLLEPAWSLAKSLDHKQSYLPILHGLWVHFLTKGSLAVSMAWAEQMLATATACQDQDLEISAHRLMLASYFWLGDLVAAGRHADIIESTYDPQRHWHIANLTNNDPLTAVGTYRAHYLWMLGYPEQAMLACDAKDEHARRRNHPFDLGFALTLGSHAFDYCCVPERLLLRAEEAERVGRERGVSLMSEVMAQIIKGVAWLRAGRIADSIGQLRESIGRLSKTGHRIYVPYLRALLADAIAREGDLEGGLALVDESLAQIERQGERVHLAELLRLKGWILKEQGKLDEAEQNLRAALDVAREQHAKSWELRASTTLARLWQSLGKTKEAHDLLAPIYGWFTEGFETKDLKEARTLLDKLT